MTRTNSLLPIPNHPKIECIRVPKIFDWVITPACTQQTVPIPDSCLPTIENIPNLTIKCMSPTNGFELLQLAQTRIISIKRSTQMAVANFLCYVPVILSFLNLDLPHSPAICTVKTTIQVPVRDVVIYLPEPLNKQNIVCRVISCEGTGIVWEKKAQLDLNLWISVQVEAEVKLEIPAKFCQPRPPMSVPAPPSICPEILFPPDCSFFPPRPPLCPVPITDEFCGNFQISCDGSRQTIWENIDISPSPSGTVTILLKEGCTSINVIINGSQIFEVRKGQSISQTFDFLEKVEIQCRNGRTKCVGKYCMTIHYFVFVPSKS